MARGRIVIDSEHCKGCELCVAACPLGVIFLADSFNARGYRPARFADPSWVCTGCAVCALVCPDVAITVYRQVARRPAGMPPG